jgi:predicted AlkP superfamily pyrophosphatase or phosphodiesterase
MGQVDGWDEGSALDRKRMIYLMTLLFMVVWAPRLSRASDTDLENALQTGLEESNTLLKRIKEKLVPRSGISADLSRLKSVAEEIRISHLLLQERFSLREEKLRNLGSKAQARHRAMTEGYRKALQDYLNLVASLPTEDEVSPAFLENLQNLLDNILPKKRRPILGSLPYRHLQYSLKDPNADPPITPAYLGGNTSVTPEDLKDPSSKVVSALAQSLNWNPVSIYEWVKNNVETEWYFGCMKGAEETLRQKSGNDCDQATLLAALLRAAGFPSRYVRGIIEFFPDITQAKNLTGIEDEKALASFFQKGGIPFRPIIAGGRIANFQVEHIWVESRIPYSNYRGAVLDEEGKSWIALDTSIKAAGYDSNLSADLPPEPFFSEIRDQYLDALRTETPLEFIQSKLEAYLSLNQPEKQYADLLRRRTLLPEVLNILPASLQFRPIHITHEYAEIPEALVHRVKMIASRCGLRVAGCGADQELFNVTLAAAQVSNQKVVLTYEPESVEDQEVIHSYGGLDNTPAYLVRLRPVLKVNEERIVVAEDGLAMGENYTLTVEMISPNGVETFTSHPIIGNLSVLGIVSQKAFLDSQLETRNPQPDASELLYEAALRYTDRWGQAEDELASLMRLSLSRPIPSLVLVGGMINVTYLLDTPHGFEWKGVFVDAALRAASTVTCCGLRGGELGNERVKTFMQLSGLQGSILENRIFEDDFKVESISTAKLFTLLNSQPATRNSLLTLTSSNTPTLLPTLPFPEEIKEDIANAVNQGWVVRIPSSEITYRDWRGIGYLKEDPESAEAGWMLSGEIAGGNSVDDPSNWSIQDFVNRLSRPYTGEVNDNRGAAAAIVKISVTDQKTGVAGRALTQPLGVYVRDRSMKPVVGANVTFQIVAGGGKLLTGPANSEMVETVTVQTNQGGIAVASLVLGKRTSDNPAYMLLEEADLYMTQVGLNLVTAAVESDAGTIPLEAPFVAYGKPDLPHHLLKAFPEEGRTVTALVSNPAGSLRVIVADQYQNPISNLDVLFNSLPAAPNPTPLSPPRNIQFYEPDECPNPYPLFGDCPTTETLTIKTQYFGAIVNTILGNTVNTKYEVQVITANLDPVTFTLYSDGFREPGTYIAPSLYLRSLQIVDDKGNPVNAAKVGTRLNAPLVSELFELSDEYIMEEGSLCRDTGLPNCWRIKASGLVNITPIGNGTVDYRRVAPTESQPGEIPTENLGNGKYRAPYTTAPTAGKNLIEATGSATLTVPIVYYNPVTNDADTEGYVSNTLSTASVLLQSGQSVLFDRNTQNSLVPNVLHKALYTVYGVDIQLTIDPSIIVLNDTGRTTRNVTFRYTILPGEYEPNLVMIELYRGTSRPNIPGEGWDGYILGDKGIPVAVGSGTERRGSAVLAAGSPFDITLFYAAEATLNRGTTTEIRSGKEVVAGGLSTVQRTDIPIAKILVKSDVMAGISSSSVDQIRFGNGAHPAKTYRIELQSRVLVESCENLNGSGLLRVINKNGVLIAPPDSSQNIHYPLASHPLQFVSQNGQCLVKVQNPTALRDRFVLSNLSLEALGVIDKAVLYGGLGNQVEVDINGAKKEIPIEPVEVIVIGIDGLRQDVLYDSTEASYLDSVGCGGSPCYVDRATLPGLSQILTEAGTIKLRGVTAVFPSITLASWASIFTGKMPGEHGILGNEFFARDLIFARDLWSADQFFNVPSRFHNPAGIISFSSGAFPGYDTFGATQLDDEDFFIPFQEDWSVRVDTGRTPQNGPMLQAKTLYESINEIPGIRDSFVEKGGDVSVVAYSHYAKGAARWLTWDRDVALSPNPSDSFIDHSGTLDKASWSRLDDYLLGKYQTPVAGLPRNDIPFSALTTWYLSGLDHEAHIKGMEAYRDYFIETTDFYINKAVERLKNIGEFDNKIFIITADHGATAMPENLKYKDINFLGFQVERDAEMSCELKLNFVDPENPSASRKLQRSERENNNLHIWELAEMMKLVGKFTRGQFSYRVLAPETIAALYSEEEFGARANMFESNLIAALNGPMAHIYSTDLNDVGKIAEIFRLVLEGEHILEAVRWFNLTEKGYKDLRSSIGRLNDSVDKILIRKGNQYCVFDGLNDDGSIRCVEIDPFNTPEYVAAWDRINGMNHEKRSGDIVLLMKSDANDVNRRFTTGVSCRSWHGSLNRSDSYVPFIVAYPGGNKTEIEKIVQRDTLCKADNSGCKGNWKLTDIVKEIISEQYGR